LKRLKNSPRRHGGTEPEEKVGCWFGSVFAALETSPALPPSFRTNSQSSVPPCLRGANPLRRCVFQADRRSSRKRNRAPEWTESSLLDGVNGGQRSRRRSQHGMQNGLEGCRTQREVLLESAGHSAFPVCIPVFHVPSLEQFSLAWNTWAPLESEILTRSGSPSTARGGRGRGMGVNELRRADPWPTPPFGLQLGCSILSKSALSAASTPQLNRTGADPKLTTRTRRERRSSPRRHGVHGGAKGCAATALPNRSGVSFRTNNSLLPCPPCLRGAPICPDVDRVSLGTALNRMGALAGMEKT
jgi:hypothetical protein